MKTRPMIVVLVLNESICVKKKQEIDIVFYIIYNGMRRMAYLYRNTLDVVSIPRDEQMTMLLS